MKSDRKLFFHSSSLKRASLASGTAIGFTVPQHLHPARLPQLHVIEPHIHRVRGQRHRIREHANVKVQYALAMPSSSLTGPNCGRFREIAQHLGRALGYLAVDLGEFLGFVGLRTAFHRGSSYAYARIGSARRRMAHDAVGSGATLLSRNALIRAQSLLLSTQIVSANSALLAVMDENEAAY